MTGSRCVDVSEYASASYVFPLGLSQRKSTRTCQSPDSCHWNESDSRTSSCWCYFWYWDAYTLWSCCCWYALWKSWFISTSKSYTCVPNEHHVNHLFLHRHLSITLIFTTSSALSPMLRPCLLNGLSTTLVPCQWIKLWSAWRRCFPITCVKTFRSWYK